VTAPVDLAAEVAAVDTAANGAALAGKAAQGIISAAAMRDAAKLWPLLDAKRLDVTFPAWLQAMTLLIRRYHSQSSLASGATYRAARELHTQSPAPRSLIRIAPPPPDQWVSKALGFSGPGMLSRDTVKPNTALSTTLGTTARIVQDGGRTTTLDTVHADPVAVGWYRVTDGHPCSFCALLASRGVAYKSEKTASFEAHNLCGGTAAPAFTGDHELPAISTDADRVYRDRNRILRDLGLNPKDYTALQAFRIAWEHRQPA
jgi:hypothetical protein